MGDRAAVYGRQSSNKAKSISEQIEAGHQVIAGEGWEHAGDYQDGRSASRFGTRKRDDWERLLDDVRAAGVDVLILWESSRGDRKLSEWSQFLDSCRSSKVRIHVISHDRTYDLTNARDWKVLAEDGVSNAYESELLSIRTRRGHAGAAAKGLPPGGPTPYGYRRNFDPESGKRLGQVVFESEAVVVRQIFDRVATGHPILRIANDLNALRTTGRTWTPTLVRQTVKNPVYVALRVHDGIEYPGQWGAIVSDEVFNAVRRLLSSPGRKVTLPGRQKHLLSYLATCDVCEDWMNYARTLYVCRKGCVGISKDVADQAISEFVIGRLQLPDALKALQDNDDADVQRAEDEAEALRLELADWQNRAAKRQVSAASFAAIEPGLLDAIREADDRAAKLAVPLVMRDMLREGRDQVPTRWNAATVVAQRTVIKALCDVRVAKGTPGRKSTFERLAPSRWHGDDQTWGQLWSRS